MEIRMPLATFRETLNRLPSTLSQPLWGPKGGCVRLVTKGCDSWVEAADTLRHIWVRACFPVGEVIDIEDDGFVLISRETLRKLLSAAVDDHAETIVVRSEGPGYRVEVGVLGGRGGFAGYKLNAPDVDSERLFLWLDQEESDLIAESVACGQRRFTANASDFVIASEQVAVASARTQESGSLIGLRLTILAGKNEMRFEATDGTHAIRFETGCDVGPEAAIRDELMLLGKHSLAAVTQAFSKEEAVNFFFPKPGFAVFSSESGDCFVFCGMLQNVLARKYWPNLDDLFEAHKLCGDAGVRQFLRSVEPLVDLTGKTRQLDFRSKGGKLTASVDSDKGAAESMVPAYCYEDFEVSVNSRKLWLFLSSLPADSEIKFGVHLERNLMVMESGGLTYVHCGYERPETPDASV